MIFFLLIAGLTISCSKTAANNSSIIQPSPIITNTDTFYKGADISWITEMEAAGLKFYNNTGTQQEGMQLLKSLGMNSIRLRVWVTQPMDGAIQPMW